MKQIICLVAVALSIGCVDKSEALRDCLQDAKKREISCAELCGAEAKAVGSDLLDCIKKCRDDYYMECR